MSAEPVSAEPVSPGLGHTGAPDPGHILSAYTSSRPAFRYDELLGPDGWTRTHWVDVASGLAENGHYGLRRLRQRVRRLVDNDGITDAPLGPAILQAAHSLAGGAAPHAVGGRWRLDGIPLVVSAEDWQRLEAGLLQRARILDALLADLYGPMRVVTDGLLPPELVFGHHGYVRAAHGITVPGAHQLFLHAADVARRPDGAFEVVGDSTAAPSGMGYAVADRRVVARALPEIYQQVTPRPLTPFLQTMRVALADAAPVAVEEPLVAILSPGADSLTAFDQAYLASMLGYPLVESADLTVRDGKLWMRSLGRLKRIDVLVRCIDAWAADPLDLRSGTRGGVVGMVEVLKRGALTVVNTLGSGVLENPALGAYLPGLAAALIDEEPLIESSPAWWAGQDVGRSHVLAHLGGLVLSNIRTAQAFHGPSLDLASLEELRRRVEADPWQWVGQQVPEFSTAPIEHGSSGFDAAAVSLRVFSVAQRAGYTVMGGGLAGALVERPGHPAALSAIAAKDVWVLAAERVTQSDSLLPGLAGADAHRGVSPLDVEGVSSPRVLTDLYWMGRYSERAEDMARLLIAVGVKYQDYRSRPWLPGSDSLGLLVTALAAAAGIATDNPEPAVEAAASTHAMSKMRALTMDAGRPGSLAHSVQHLEAAARAVRDQLSVDTWMVLSSVNTALAELNEDRFDDPVLMATAQSAVLGGMLALSGLGAESMVHDTGWYLMDIGKRVERGLQLTGLVSSTLVVARGPATERAVLESVLAASESSVMYRRRSRGRFSIAAMAELLLFDAGNPRSLIFQLERLRADLRALPDSTGVLRPQRLVDELVAQLRRADPQGLEHTDEDGARSVLAELLAAIHAGLRALSGVLMETVLTPPGDIQPIGALEMDEVIE